MNPPTGEIAPATKSRHSDCFAAPADKRGAPFRNGVDGNHHVIARVGSKGPTRTLPKDEGEVAQSFINQGVTRPIQDLRGFSLTFLPAI